MEKSGKGIVVSAFSGTGKTYLANRYTKVKDLDLGNYRFIYDGPEDVPFEARKAMKLYQTNPMWPENYFKDIVASRETCEIVLITHCPEVEEFLSKLDIPLYYFIPKASGWEVLKERLKARGNNEKYISICKAKFDADVTPSSSAKHIKIYLDENEFLDEALIKGGFLKCISCS